MRAGAHVKKSFYVQEPSPAVFGGIKVVPSAAVNVKIEDLVDVEGTVTTDGAEAYIGAAAVDVIGTHRLPRPNGMQNARTAGGAQGYQPGLYLDTYQSLAGCGTSAVGTRVSVYGKLIQTGTENGHTVYWLDDGSGLARTNDSGVKVVFWDSSDADACPHYQVGLEDEYVSVVGVLGAEVADSLPAPVVRVPNRNVVYVVEGGAGTKDGTSWSNAEDSIQDAINTASQSVPKKEVRVAEGTYSKIVLADGVAVYGGFAGNETERGQRDWTANETIIDGGQNGSVVTANSGVTATARIDGFTITNGSSRGIYCNGGVPVIANNRIVGNSTLGSGGGIYCSGGSPYPLLSIIDNDISNNSAAGSGGGVYVSASPVSMIGNTISGNEAYHSYNSTYGGGIYLGGGSSISTIHRNKVFGNTATFGGGICCNNSQVSITNNLVCDNGGGSGGGIRGNLAGNSRIVNNTVCGNTAGYIGGIYCNTNVPVVNNIIAFNSSGVSYAPGMVLTNNCIWGNGTQNYVGSTPDPDPNMIEAPFFETNGYHLDAASPCVDEGDSGYVDWETDLDGGDRIQNEDVDIGAYESNGCSCYIVTLTASPTGVLIGESATLTATVTDMLGNPIPDWEVRFSSTGGDLTVLDDRTQLDGTAQATVSSDQSETFIITAVIDQPCAGQAEDSVTVEFACPVVALTLEKAIALLDEPVQTIATVTHPFTGLPFEGLLVDITLDSGELLSVDGGQVDSPPVTGHGTTDENGNVVFYITRDSAGPVNVTVNADNNSPCSGQVEDTERIRFYDPANTVYLFFCIDCTGSMGSGGDHRAHESIRALLEDIMSAGIYLRLGGVKFSDSDGSDFIDVNNPAAFCSLNNSLDAEDFIDDWVMNGYSPIGGDDPELQLDAFHYAAQEMSAYAPSGSPRYIVLVTDAPYHENDGVSDFTKQQIINELTATGCPVFLSLWEKTPQTPQLYDPTFATTKPYNGMAVNGGKLDVPNYTGDDTPGNWRYPFTELRGEILQ